MVVVDPFQKSLPLLQLVRIEWRGIGIEFPEHRMQLLPHRLPILHRGPDIGERALHITSDPLEKLGFRLAVHLAMHDGLGYRITGAFIGGQNLQQFPGIAPAQLHHWMDNLMGGQAAAVDGHAHRIDQKRHVIGNYLDDGVRRLPAVLLEPRVVDVDLGRPWHTVPGVIQMGHRRAVEIDRIELFEVRGSDAAEVLGDELPGRGAGLRRQLLPDEGVQRLDNFLDNRAARVCHQGPLESGLVTNGGREPRSKH